MARTQNAKVSLKNSEGIDIPHIFHFNMQLSVSYTQGVLTDCLVCVVPQEFSLIILRCYAMKLKNVNIFFLFWFLKSVY